MTVEEIEKILRASKKIIIIIIVVFILSVTLKPFSEAFFKKLGENAESRLTKTTKVADSTRNFSDTTQSKSIDFEKVFKIDTTGNFQPKPVKTKEKHKKRNSSAKRVQTNNRRETNLEDSITTLNQRKLKTIPFTLGAGFKPDSFKQYVISVYPESIDQNISSLGEVKLFFVEPINQNRLYNVKIYFQGRRIYDKSSPYSILVNKTINLKSH